MTDITTPEIKKKLYDEFIAENTARIELWERTHTRKGGACPPIPVFWHNELKMWLWANRKLRRKK